MPKTVTPARRGRKPGVVYGVPKLCPYCGQTYHGYAKSKTTACTPCRKKGLSQFQSIAVAKKIPRICEFCRKPFETGSYRPSRFCSMKCVSDRNGTLPSRFGKARPPKIYVEAGCHECGIRFVKASSSRVTTGGSFCSYACKDRYHHRRRRARVREAFVEMVRLQDVVKRDKGICWLCNKEVDMSKKKPDPASPTIDHVIPLSKGGKECMDNVALAHFGCNASKHNKIVSLF